MGESVTMNDHNLDDLIIENIDPETNKTKSFLTIVALAIVVLIIAIILTKIVLNDSKKDQLNFEENGGTVFDPNIPLLDTPKKPEEIKKPDDSTKSDTAEEDPSLQIPATKRDAKPQPPKPATSDVHTTPTTSSTTTQNQVDKYEDERIALARERERIAAQKALEEKRRRERLQREAALKHKEEMALRERLKREAAEKKALQERLKREAAEKKALQERLKQEAARKKAEAEKALAKKVSTIEISDTPIMPHTTKRASKTTPKASGVNSNGLHYYIQVGYFTQSPNQAYLNTIKRSGFDYSLFTTPNGTKRLLIGPYTTRTAVDADLVKVRSRITKSAFVIKK